MKTQRIKTFSAANPEYAEVLADKFIEKSKVKVLQIDTTVIPFDDEVWFCLTLLYEFEEQ